jgi:hypothetical protein
VAALTPGATLQLTAADLCSGGIRSAPPLPVVLRAQVLRNYGMTGESPAAYEMDYLITPALGGAPAATNLWPERFATTVWNARVKDQLEALLPQLVCSGKVELRVAQHDIAANWIAAYQKYFRTTLPLDTSAVLAIDDGDDPTFVEPMTLTRLAAPATWPPRLFEEHPRWRTAGLFRPANRVASSDQ